MRLDWRRFCERHNIEYVTFGPNTARGNISIHCPWCGPADPSHHLGLKLDPYDPQWGCFRNKQHRGPEPSRLVARLLGISLKHAVELVKAEVPPPDSLGDMLQALRKPSESPQDRVQALARRVVPLTEFRLLADAMRNPSEFTQAFGQYLAGRGFGVADAIDAAKRYGLWYALSGEQRYRIVFPVYSEQTELIGWTGRDITGTSMIRYRAMAEMGKDWLLISPRREPADVLVVCEGPIDFLKIDYYGREFGIEAVGTMGTAVTQAQFAQIVRMMKTKRRAYSLFDAEAFAQSMRLAFEMSRGARFSRIPQGYEDPGALTPTSTRELARLLAG